MHAGRRALAISTFAIALTAGAATAVAGVIPSSTIGFETNGPGSAQDSDRWAGPGTGHVRSCGDVDYNSQNTFYPAIKEDKAFQPDPTITEPTLYYSAPYQCGGYAASSTNRSYYIYVGYARLSVQRHGYARAQD